VTLQAASSIQSIVLSKGLQSAHTTGLKTGREGTDTNTVQSGLCQVKSSLYINNRQPYGSLSNVLRKPAVEDGLDLT